MLPGSQIREDSVPIILGNGSVGHQSFRRLVKRQAHVELEPRSPNLFLNRGRIHILLGNSGQATADLEQVLASTQEERYVLLAKELLGFIQ